MLMNKSELRKHYKSVRNSISASDKSKFDGLIFDSFINSPFFHDFDIFLCYVSIGSEVDTLKIIDFLFLKAKRVAVPYCSGGKMSFYEINTLSDLKEGAYGIPTVDTSSFNRINDFKNALCITPALSFDKSGFRLGYGGGYYDKFLAEFNIPSLGLAYTCCLADSLPSEKHDIHTDSVLTEEGFIYLKEIYI